MNGSQVSRSVGVGSVTICPATVYGPRRVSLLKRDRVPRNPSRSAMLPCLPTVHCWKTNANDSAAFVPGLGVVP